MQRLFKGSVTIFMTCLMGIMTTFLYSLIKSAMYYSSDMNLRAAIHATGISLLSEYNKDLFDKYSILLIDTSYKGQEADDENVISHARLYLEKNSGSHNNGVAFGQLETKEVNLKKKRGPLEDNGEELISQIIHIEKEYEEMTEDVCIGEGFDSLSMDEKTINNRYEKYLEEWDDYLEYIESMDVSISNPADSLKDIRNTGLEYILDMRMIDDYSIVSNYNSKIFDDEYTDEEKEMFCTYLIRNLSSAASDVTTNEESRYEAEYIIGGCKSARENVKKTVERIVKWLFIRNYEYIWDNEDRTSEALNEAKYITDYCDDEVLVETVSNSLKCVWAYSEAILEMNALLEGSEISTEDPFDTWMLPVEEIMSYTAYFNMTGDGDCGYDDCLFQMMKDMSICEMNTRFADVLDTNIVGLGNEGYKTGKCISSFELSVNAKNNGKDVTKESERFEYRVD